VNEDDVGLSLMTVSWPYVPIFDRVGSFEDEWYRVIGDFLLEMMFVAHGPRKTG
jgi:hypothetical protein